MSGYYMMARGTVGNCAIWWAKGKHGYTTNLDEAHVFTEEEVRKGVTDRDSDIAYPVDVVDAVARRHVHFGSLGPGIVQSKSAPKQRAGRLG